MGFDIVSGVLKVYYEESGDVDVVDVVIPDGVTEIGEKAFFRCTGMRSVTMPNSVTKIGNRAFNSCFDLQSIVIPNSVKEIQECAFMCCYNLQQFTIPEGITRIEDSVFSSCKALKSIYIPDGVTSIGSSAFCCCESLQSIQLPNRLESIGRGAFDFCPSLSYLEIPEHVTTIGDFAFSAGKNLNLLRLPAALLGKISEQKALDNDAVILVKNGDTQSFWAYSFYERGYAGCDFNDTLLSYVQTGNLAEYDRELLNNGPTFKFTMPVRLVGMLGRLQEPADLSAENKQLFIDYITSNMKRLITFAEKVRCPEIITAAYNCGIINSTNEKSAKAFDKKRRAGNCCTGSAIARQITAPHTTKRMCAISAHILFAVLPSSAHPSVPLPHIMLDLPPRRVLY